MILTVMFEVSLRPETPDGEPVPIACALAVDAAEAIGYVACDSLVNPKGLPPERFAARLAEFDGITQAPRDLTYVYPRVTDWTKWRRREVGE